MSKSPTIIDDRELDDPEQWLANPHAGEMLWLEFMQPIGLTAETLATALDLPSKRVSDVIGGKAAIDAGLDLRLGRYFGMSEGFFMRLQVSYEIMEQRRALGSDLDRITPRAA